ncbi:MBL fold metallo-hydrolase [Pseudomaricurvus sp.]|uniref:MBL fold metallo-hydrolase n=1 Tax=Pseudomaricurvus sp. TaxID=2004510 RepID=UPI003F6B5E56
MNKITGIPGRHWLKGLLLTVACTSVSAHQHLSHVEFKQVPVLDGVVMLQGSGGNIAVSTGDDGLLVIDDDYQGLGEKLTTSLNELDDRGPRFLLNTHWHSDHTGNNDTLGTQGAIIVAQDNVRKRLQTGGVVEAFNMNVPPAKPEALPVATYDESMKLYWNGWRLELSHIEAAHTDGDTVVYFYQQDKVKLVHTGDLFFNGFYPFLDSSSGGSAKGMVKGAAEILARIDDDTVIIPGHGPLASKADLQAYYEFMDAAVSKIDALKTQGKSADEVVAAKPLAEFEAEWGDGFLKTDQWVRIVYNAL